MSALEDKKNIVSFFKTVQGEGRNAGQLVHFIRLYSDHCFPNRERCSFCDTVNREMFKQSMTANELVKHIRELPLEEIPSHYVITGGEPFSYSPKEILDLCNKLIAINVVKDLPKPKFDFETNGSFFNKDTLVDSISASFLHMVLIMANQISLSPKLSNSYAKGNMRPMESVYDFEIIRQLHEDYKHIDFKFVVAVDDEEQMKSDMDDVLKFMYEGNISEKNIWIMPMTPYNNKDNLIELADWTVENNFNYSNRLHVQIWGSDIVQEK